MFRQNVRVVVRDMRPVFSTHLLSGLKHFDTDVSKNIIYSQMTTLAVQDLYRLNK